MPDDPTNPPGPTQTTPPPASEPNPPPAPPPGQPDQTQVMQQTLAHLEALQQKMQQHDALLATQIQGTQQQAPAEDEYVDPAVEKRLGAAQRTVMQELQAVQDRIDANEYQSRIRELALDADAQKKIDGLYANWLSRGVTIQGKPPSRLDALHYGLGVMAAENTHKTRQQKAADEQRRQSEVLSGFVERPTARRTAPGMDPDTMSRRERLDKYWPEALKDGF